MANGGRIVNMSSVSARCNYPEIRYGPSKAALSYFSHVLRMEVGPRFGVWVSAVEPGLFKTNMMKNVIGWQNKVKEKLKEENKTEIMDIYDWNADRVNKSMELLEEGKGDLILGEDISKVVDCVIHGLTAKYPKRRYEVGWDAGLKFLVYWPMWITEPVAIFGAKQQRQNLKKLVDK